MSITATQAVLALGSGGVVGLILMLVGSGGSILAVPLLIYLVGVSSTHVAIGTGAIAVTLSAAMGLATHARLGTVKWRCAVVFAAAGIIGAALGAEVGKAVDGQQLLALFGLAMIVIGGAMLRSRAEAGNENVRLTSTSAAYLLPRLLIIGFGAGLLAGFFGIGGGFLIVPGLMLATGMPLASAVGTSLVALTAFGLTTASSYALSGLIDWPLVLAVVAGGVAGTALGWQLNPLLVKEKRLLSQLFEGLTIVVGVAVFVQGFSQHIGI